MNNPNENKELGLPEENAEEKKARINRVIYVTAIALLLSVAIIAGIVSAANRAKKEPVETLPPSGESTGPNSGTRPEGSEPPQSSEGTGSESEKLPDESVSTKLPTFALPVSGTLSVEHDPDLQVFSPTMKDYRVHLGVDINTSVGASVTAAADGVIEKVWEDPMMGMCVAVSHSGDCYTIYKNLDVALPASVTVGSEIKAGDTIGNVGQSAILELAEEPHLHYEMKINGKHVDPKEHLPIPSPKPEGEGNANGEQSQGGANTDNQSQENKQ